MAFRSPQGPLKEFTGKVIAVIPCTADPTHAPIEVKVNSSGWPYFICKYCIQGKSQSLASARAILGTKGIRWVKGRKAPVLAAMDAAERGSDPDPEPEIEQEYELEELVSDVPAPKKKRGIRTYFDDE